mmetsp:Transcript_48073/g.103008  ORF Transcript_48073/g.103008 Transcript_48073/m.103008 type:complete len:374 (-) Transcript_48073:43-1164(-)|eukprot:CAMPEP_0206582170 /NCGR_PEP_ID=MMETSP0325_2-20121206/34308_1 /ASSEMBLY_ACC=CAM_ASM_000347 /TAXON_ID=2866 /ORGANISM="Crypthecodinium cohnii, Strain Seligo" /LENGTH=373 /DNA_ID=CAMNT_0054088767 /DNA_START=185 /DNA_END=1306 /DNA_ORIENTATION=+
MWRRFGDLLRHSVGRTGGQGLPRPTLPHQAPHLPASGSASIFSSLGGLQAANAIARRWAGCYSRIIKRNRVPFIDFETGFPKKDPEAPNVVGAFTLAKQQKLDRLLAATPQKTFRGRVIPKLSTWKIKHGGRNDKGHMVTRHRGGGTLHRLRFVDFKRGRRDIPATVLRIEHSPDRTSHVALIQYEDGVLSYILAPLTMRPGDTVVSSENANIVPGNCLPLRNIPAGSIIHNIELRPGAGGQFIRAAGTYAVIITKDSEYATIKLRSTEIRKFPLDCWATIGQLGNLERFMRFKGKAGVNRWLGFRPSVRGNAMNPAQHPHGGGTKAKHTKRPPVSPWGILRTGYKTRSPTKPMGLIVRRALPGKQQKKFGIA